MGLEIEREFEQGTARGRHYTIPERLYKTKEGEIVPQGDPEANSLFKPAGAKILMSEAVELGLVKEEKEPVKEKPAPTKQAAKAKDKKAATKRNKSRGGK